MKENERCSRGGVKRIGEGCNFINTCTYPECVIKEETILSLYYAWCKETKRNGAILIGGSIREFFVWLENNNYRILKK